MGSSLVALRSQVKEIARVEAIEIRWIPVRRGASGESDHRARTITTRYIGSVDSYATAMHELGHILSGVTSPREGESGYTACRRLANEAAAWDWALQHMPREIARSERVTNHVILSLRSYLWFAHCFSTDLPPDDSLFWKLYRLDWDDIYWPRRG